MNFTIRASGLRRNDRNLKLLRVKDGQMIWTYWMHTKDRNTEGGSKADIHVQYLWSVYARQNTGDIALN